MPDSWCYNWVRRNKKVQFDISEFTFNHLREIDQGVMHLILQADDALTDKGSAKKHSAPPEYLEKRKQERERRRSETGLRQKFKRGVRKSDTTMEVRYREKFSLFFFHLAPTLAFTSTSFPLLYL